MSDRDTPMSISMPIFVVTGTPGSGKTTVARALMRRFPFGLHIPVDDLREWVVSGIAHPVPVWTEETSRQFRLARQAVAEIARRYAEAGFAVALDDVILPQEVEELFVAALPGRAVHRVLLRPSLAVALARNRARDGKGFDPAILEETIRRLHAEMTAERFADAGWLVVDNGALTLEATVDAILERLGQDPTRHGGLKRGEEKRR